VNTTTIIAQGFVTGASLILPIGAQNAFLLERGILRNYALLTAAIFLCGDMVLICLGVGGLGEIIAHSPRVHLGITLAGVVFLGVYGWQSFSKARHSLSVSMEPSGFRLSGRTVLLSTLAVTFLNPHVYLDTVVIQGSVSGQYPRELQHYFVIGSILASAIWFFGLAWLAGQCARWLQQPRSQAGIQIVVGGLMWWIAGQLLLQVPALM
jgi:L-lysine exporter family protein LysE/ArgO